MQVDNDTTSDPNTTVIGVVAEDADAGTNWATELDDWFATSDAERVTSGQALGNLSKYDAYFVLTLADNDTSVWFDETDDVPTVYTVVGDYFGDDPLGSKSLVQRSSAIGDPATAGGYTDGYLSWTVTTDHPLFDGVASVGDKVTVSGKWYADGGSFTGTSATAIADTDNGERGVAVDDSRRDVLLGSVGSSSTASPDDYTDDTFAVVANALEYYADASATIEGTVTDTDGSVIEGATVEAAGNRSLETTTDADGTYDLPVSAGEPLNVSATVENTGDHGTIRAAEFTLAPDGKTVTGVIDVVDLAASESVTVETTIDTSGLAPGTHTLEIATDDDTETVTVTITSSSSATTIAGPPAIRP